MTLGPARSRPAPANEVQTYPTQCVFQTHPVSVGRGAGPSAIYAALIESHAINETAEGPWLRRNVSPFSKTRASLKTSDRFLDVRLKLSAVTARRGMLSKRLHDTAVGLHRPLRELRSLSDGETADSPGLGVTRRVALTFGADFFSQGRRSRARLGRRPRWLTPACGRRCSTCTP